MPITRKEFKKSSTDLEKEIVTFLNARKNKAYTSEEIMGATSFHTDFDLQVTPKISFFVTANFVAFLNDLAAKGTINRKVVNNRMYFTAATTR
jgi:Pyruvate/2-oxoacid:ferredoxin oxidoreductase gamma subunit